jgi:predicted nucleotidyltransferase
MHPLIEQHRDAIRALAARRGIKDVRLFGSMAQGEIDVDRQSDIDLLVSLPPGRSGLALGGLLMDVQELTQRKVDVVTEASLAPALRDRILREAQPL